MANTGLTISSSPRPTSILAILAAVSVAMCLCIGSADMAVGEYPTTRSRFLASVVEKDSACDPGSPGACSGRPAGQYLKCCDRKCVDVRTSRENCGACGVQCAYGQLCCGSNCTTVAYDAENCGSCGRVCPGKRRCTYGMCGYA